MYAAGYFDDDSYDRLAIRVSRYIGKDDELDDVMNDAKRIAYTIQTDDYDICRESVSEADVCDVAPDALYYRRNDRLP